MQTVNVDITQYVEAIKFISEHNKCFEGKDAEIQQKLNGLIRDSIKEFHTVGTMGLSVSSHVEYDDEIYINILVDPSVSKESFYIKMAI